LGSGFRNLLRRQRPTGPSERARASHAPGRGGAHKNVPCRPSPVPSVRWQQRANACTCRVVSFTSRLAFRVFRFGQPALRTHQSAPECARLGARPDVRPPPAHRILATVRLPCVAQPSSAACSRTVSVRVPCAEAVNDVKAVWQESVSHHHRPALRPHPVAPGPLTQTAQPLAPCQAIELQAIDYTRLKTLQNHLAKSPTGPTPLLMTPGSSPPGSWCRIEPDKKPPSDRL